ncbi:MAG: class I SAM-dependent methyltransferase [Terrimicrobiaceae bacterium]
MSLNATQEASREQFERQSRNYGSSHILADTSDIAEALGDLVAGVGRAALDIATGGGHTAVFLAANGWNVTASDLTPAMLTRAGELASERGVAIRTALHEAERLPYPEASFDLVTCRVAAHHFSDPAAFVSEVRRILAPGGHFLLIDGSVPDGASTAEEWIHSVEKLRDPSHARFLSPSAWTQLCEASGLRVLSARLTPFKQPDLEWYFQTAATPPENRAKVVELVRSAPSEAREAFQIGHEDGKTVWWWPRLALLARRQPGAE